VLAIDALRRAQKAAPSHAHTLRALASLYVAQGSWAEAAPALGALVRASNESAVKLSALFELAEMYAGALAKPQEVERVLRDALAVDAANVRALRELVAIRREAKADAKELVELAARLAEAEPAGDAKSAAWLELASLKSATGDRAGAEVALVEATALAAQPAALARLLDATSGDAAAQATALASVALRAQTLGRPNPAALAALGRLEIDALARPLDGVGHLRAALAIDPSLHEARSALARGLVAARAAAEASATIFAMLSPTAAPLLALQDPARAIATLEQALALEGRREEAIVARELIAIAGGLSDGAHVELRARRLALNFAAPPYVFDRNALHGHLVPPEAHVALYQAAAIVGAEEKLVRTDLAELGITPRDRVAPASGHALLAPLGYVARMFGLDRPELVVSDQITYARVGMVSGAPWVLVPESLSLLPEPVQLVEVARMVARIATGVPWLADLPATSAHALLCAAVRAAIPDFATDLSDRASRDLIDDEESRVARALGRKQKKALSELAPHFANTRSPDVAQVEALVTALARAEARTAFVVSGDLLATIDALRNGDSELARASSNVGPPALAAVLAHPIAGDAARFALGTTATALRWRAGSLWTARR
jgi:hypothetical protein